MSVAEAAQQLLGEASDVLRSVGAPRGTSQDEPIQLNTDGIAKGFTDVYSCLFGHAKQLPPLLKTFARDFEKIEKKLAHTATRQTPEVSAEADTASKELLTSIAAASRELTGSISALLGEKERTAAPPSKGTLRSRVAGQPGSAFGWGGVDDQFLTQQETDGILQAAQKAKEAIDEEFDRHCSLLNNIYFGPPPAAPGAGAAAPAGAEAGAPSVSSSS
eukprot:tig00000792_g4189.t1